MLVDTLAPSSSCSCHPSSMTPSLLPIQINYYQLTEEQNKRQTLCFLNTIQFSNLDFSGSVGSPSSSETEWQCSRFLLPHCNY